MIPAQSPMRPRPVRPAWRKESRTLVPVAVLTERSAEREIEVEEESLP